MKDSTFTLDQITHLREIERARVRSGLPGLRQDLQDLIRRSAVVADPKPKSLGETHYPEDYIRHDQAKVLWEKGWGKELGYKTFEEYLASIPAIPSEFVEDDLRFPLLTLVDGRVGLRAACYYSGIRFFGHEFTYAPYGSTKTQHGVRWMRCHDGSRNKRKSVKDCLESFYDDEEGLDIIEGIALFVHHPGDNDFFPVFPQSIQIRGRVGEFPVLVHIHATFHGTKLTCWSDDHGCASRRT